VQTFHPTTPKGLAKAKATAGGWRLRQEVRRRPHKGSVPTISRWLEIAASSAETALPNLANGQISIAL